MRNPFDVLGLAPGTPLPEVRKAFRRLALKHHPDRNPGDAKATARFREVKEAYEAIQKGRTAPIPEKYRRHARPGETLEDLLERMRRSGGWTRDEVGEEDVYTPHASHAREAPYQGPYAEVPDLASAWPNLCVKCRGMGEIARSRGFVILMVACPACRQSTVRVKGSRPPPA